MIPETFRIRTEDDRFQQMETLRRNRVKRNHSGEFFVEGVRSINQAIRNGWKIDALAFSREKRLSDWAEGVLANAGARKHYELPLRLMEKLSEKDDVSELIAIVAMPPDDLSRIHLSADPLIVILDRPNNPGNIGTIIRSCDALGVDGLIISGHSADLYDPETIRATAGSFFCLPVVRLPSHKELLPWLDGLRQQVRGFQVVGTSAKAELPIRQHDFTTPTLLLIGNETNGLSDAYQALSDRMVTIPQVGSASSLNVACAVSILLYETVRQRGR
jgi:TrmH family RNA methyltransferase